MSHLHKLAFVACRIISVYLLANWLGAFSRSVVALFADSFRTPNILIGVVGMAIPMLIGVLIWIFSNKLAGFMVKPQEGQDANLMSVTFDLDTIQVLAFTVMGVFLIVNTVPSLVSTLAVYAILPKPDIGQVRLEVLSALLNSGIQIIMGVWLVLGGKGLVALIKKIRTVGVK